MKKNLNAIFIAVIGIIVFAITLTSFFLSDFEKTAVSWWAFGFMLLSEIIVFLGIWFTSLFKEANKVLLRSGIISILTLYFIANLIISLFSKAFNNNINLFIKIEIFVIAIVLIGIALILFFSNRINTSDSQIVSDRKLMQICQKRIYDLMVDSKNNNFKTKLQSIYEQIKYCDNIGASSVDEKIVGSVIKIEKQLKSYEINSNDINDLFNEISTLIAQRNMEIAETKRGAF